MRPVLHYALGFVPAALSLLSMCFLPDRYGDENYVFVEEFDSTMKISSVNGFYMFVQAWWAAIALGIMDWFKKNKTTAIRITVIAMLLFIILWLFSIMLTKEYNTSAFMLIISTIYMMFTPLWIDKNTINH